MRTAWEDVNRLYSPILEILTYGGHKRIAMPSGDINQIKAEKYAEVFDFIHRFIGTEPYNDAIYAWKLLTPKMWANYKMVGAKGLREQKILEAALLGLRKWWKTRPTSFFGKHYDDQSTQEDCTETPVQAEGAGSAKDNRGRRQRRLLSPAGDGVPAGRVDGSGRKRRKAPRADSGNAEHTS